eukprot:m.137818 g.137818  ORF g.137818 m.137818 type:complete len:488 (-) comp14761_c1_seq2:24-1487(-)
MSSNSRALKPLSLVFLILMLKLVTVSSTSTALILCHHSFYSEHANISKSVLPVNDSSTETAGEEESRNFELAQDKATNGVLEREQLEETDIDTRGPAVLPSLIAIVAYLVFLYEETKTKNLEEKLEDLTTKIHSLESETDNYKLTIINLKKSVNDCKEENNALQNKNCQLQEAKNELEAQQEILKTQQETIEKLTKDLDGLEGKNKLLEKENEKLKYPSEALKGEKTLKSSKFNKIYSQTAAEFGVELFYSVLKFITLFAKKNRICPREAETFYKKLEKEADKGDLGERAQKLWTTDLTLEGRWFCSMLNEAIRKDEVDMMPYVAVIVRAINMNCIARNHPNLKHPFPPNSTVYRGAVIPEEYLSFFIPGRCFRAPMFLATSFSEKVAEKFYEGHCNGTNKLAVKFIVHVDPAGEFDNTKRCQNANLLTNSKFQGEKEYLFVPYSVFTVRLVKLSPNNSDQHPHIIHLEAAVDNSRESHTLSLAPWI